MKKLLSLSLLCVAVALAVAPVHADTKTDETRVKRLPLSDTVTFDDVTYDMVGYTNGHMTAWEREAGGIRSLFKVTVKAKLYYEGEMVGQVVSHMSAVAVQPDGMQDFVNQMDMVVTLRGSGSFVNYHFVIVVRNGQIVTTHTVGTPPA